MAEKPKEGAAPAKVEKTPVVDVEHQRYSERVEARDRADLMRAAFEKEHKAGKTPEGDRAKAFEAIVKAYRAAIDLDPRGEIGTACRLRLAGAYTYIGEFGSAARVMEETVNVAAGAKEQVLACHALGMHYLQAMHKPAEALPWFRRAEVSVGKIEDEQERAKWAAAVAEGVARSERERR